MNKTTIVLSATVVALLGYIVFFNGDSHPTEDKYAKQKQEIESLNLQLVKLQNQQEIQDALIRNREDSIEVLRHQIDIKNQNIKTIQKRYENKIKAASNFTPTQLDSFFTNRYQH